MGFSATANLVIGVSMTKLFNKIEENSDVFDEHDRFGKKTGKQFKEEKLFGYLNNGKRVIISNKKIFTNNILPIRKNC